MISFDGFDYSDNILMKVLLRLLFLVILSTILLGVSAKFSVKDLSHELNNISERAVFGIVVSAFLYLFFTFLALPFVFVYIVYFAAKIDENNNFLYNTQQELDDTN